MLFIGVDKNQLFKKASYLKALKMMKRVMDKKKDGLFISLIIPFFLPMTSMLMYYVENEAQP